MKALITIPLIFMMFISIAQNDSIENKLEYKVFQYPNGNIASKGYLKDNQPDGFWESYYITGVKKSEGLWKNNKLDSVWIFYNQVGDTTEKINYYLGKKNGYQYKYNTSLGSGNRIISKELYVNGKRNGETLYYYKSGKLKESIPYIDDKKQGIGYQYDNNENIITITRFKNNQIIVQERINRFNSEGEKDGIWKVFYLNGSVKQEKNYTNGKLDGYVKLYNEEGKLINSIKYNNGEVDLNAKDFEENIELKEKFDEQDNLIFQGSFKNNKPIGIHRYFNTNGNVIKSETYDINGQLIAKGIVLINGWEEGSWVYYYNDGKIKAKGNYSKGKKTGKWTYYYSNGKIQQIGSYTSGKYTGLWQWFYNTGELLKEEYYIFGQLDGESTELSVMGDIISKGNYIEGNKEGEWIYIVGDQKYIGNYVLNEKDGFWKSYYKEEGTLSFKGKYVQGRPDGKLDYFYPNGDKKEEQYYDDGLKIKSWSKYDENGNLIIVIQYKEGNPYKINGVKVNLDSN